MNFISFRYEIYFVLTFFASVLFFAFFVGISLEGNKTTNMLFNHKALYFIGNISYGIYVYHFMLKPFFKIHIYSNLYALIPNGIISSTIYTLFSTAILILLTRTSWNLLESPILKLKKYFNY